MKNLKALFVLLILLSTKLAICQTLQNLTLPVSAAGKSLYSVSSQGSNLYIAGDGCILKSANNGSTWSVIYSDNTKLFFDVKFPNAQVGYAVGWAKSENALNKTALLYKTDDGGITWSNIFQSTRKAQASTKFTEGQMRNGAIDCLDESRLIWSVGSGQYYSVTGGRGNHVVLGGTQSYTALLPNINKAFWGSSGILESTKGGVTAGMSGYQAYDYYDFDLLTPDIFYASTNTNEIYKIQVNQTNTSSYKIVNGAGINSRFFGVDFIDLNIGYVVGDSGKIFETINGGNSWSKITNTNSNQLNDIHFYSASDAIIIGNNGTLLKLSNNIVNPNAILFNPKPIYNESSSEWLPVVNGVTNDLYEVEINFSSVYIAGDGIILKSTNLGASFNTVYSNSNYKFRDITFTSANNGWVIAYNISQSRVDVLKTIDGGANWTLQTSITGTSAGIVTGLCIEALNSNFVLASVAVGVNTNKKYTTNGGVTWQSIGGNFTSAAISDFIFFGNNYNANGEQGYGAQIVGGGTYLSTNITTGAANTIAGCYTLTYPNAVKNYGTNSISSASNHMCLARDMDWNNQTFILEGWFERTKVANPVSASDWACYPTYTAVNFYGVKMISNSEIWLVGEKGTIITTKNGGMISQSSAPNPQKEWYGHNTNSYNNLFDIENINDSIYIVVGSNGTVLRTVNANSESLVSSALISTNSVTSITASGTICGGLISGDGGSNIISRGVCWSTSANPTTSNTITTDGSGTGSFISTVTNLQSNTTYYLRAYAINSTGTFYGNQVTFKTNLAITLPVITTSAVASITSNSAISGGFVSSNGGSNVTSRGICWSTSANPTTTNSKTIDGLDTGTFISNITSLQPNTTYYVRAYATNSVGTAYGNQVTFTTSQVITLPILTTSTVTSITSNSAISGGFVSSNGGSNVTSSGICWSTSANPTTSNSKTTDGSGTGSFISTIINLQSNTTYYVRAYATNAIGTAYGNEISFTTTGLNPGCVNTVIWPTAAVTVPQSVGQTIEITPGNGELDCNFAGEYSRTQGWKDGLKYTIYSTRATDFITITDDNNVVIKSGVQPLEFTNAGTSVKRIHVNLNSSCATEDACRDISIKLNASTGLSNYTLLNDVQLFPNPTYGLLYYRGEVHAGDIIEIYYSNCLGQRRPVTYSITNLNTLELKLPDDAFGLINIEIKINMLSNTQKVLIIK